MHLPAKKSYYWINVFAIVFTVNFFVLLHSMVILKVTFDSTSIFSIIILSFFPSIFILLGYLGMRLFSFIVILSDFIAIILVYYISFTDTSLTWSDLATKVGYMYVIGIGIILGLTIQIIYLLIIYRRLKQGNN